MTLEREILDVLGDLGGMLVTERSVYNHTRLATGGRVGMAEVEEALRRLERKRQVAGVRHEDYGMRWQITDEGRVRLLS